MNERTREYLRGRFGDHYRRSDIALPPAASAREWGFIPFTSGPGTTMVRHKALHDLGDLSAFLVDTCPRHVYFSAGQYDDPGTRSMEKKGWRGSDLVFDLDADHLPGVDPDDDAYAEMLRSCKEALVGLLDFLHGDFGFDPEQTSVVFSGSRGYHVHVRSERVRTLDRDARREIVEYVLGEGIGDVDQLACTETVAGMGRSTPATKQTLKTDGGWGRRVHDRLVALTESVQTAEKADAIKQLRAFEGIGEKGATKLYETMTERREEIVAGNLDAGKFTHRLAQQLFERAVEEKSVPIDEPVTTDVHRLIRLPGSLHGGSGFLVTPLDHDEIESFDPFEKAVPSTFKDAEIRIETEQEIEIGKIGGERDKIQAGNDTVQESVGVFLMARGRAEKAPE